MRYVLLFFLAIVVACGSAALSLKYNTPQGEMYLHCGLRSEIVTRLAGKYAEKLMEIGVTTEGHVVELWANQNTWTLFITDGYEACVWKVGEGWQRVATPGRAS